MEAIYCPAWEAAYGDGGTSHLISGCGGTVSFTKPFVHPGSLLHCGLSNNHDAGAQIEKAPRALGACRRNTCGSAGIPARLRGKVYTGGVLVALLYGCESRCLTAEPVR